MRTSFNGNRMMRTPSFYDRNLASAYHYSLDYTMSKLTNLLTQQLCTLFVVLMFAGLLLAQQSTIASLRSSDADAIVTRIAIDSEPPPHPGSPGEIIANFIRSEARVREALNQHTFKREVVLQTVNESGQVTGEYIRDSQFLFDDRGNRIERVTYHPPSTIREMRITREDIQDLAGAQLLGMDITEAGKYSISYAGSEKIDDRDLYALDILPIQKPDPQRMKERFFIGRVWIDPTTYHLVRVKGIVEPHGKQRFPHFETWRAPVGDGFFFPVHTEADDVLAFPGRDVHYRIMVKYYGYKRFASRLTITEIDGPSTKELSPRQ